ncbi:MAG: sodium/proton-translocating pyrophosphatase [Candidatus Margulisiibacteriota bacterium]
MLSLTAIPFVLLGILFLTATYFLLSLRSSPSLSKIQTEEDPAFETISLVQDGLNAYLFRLLSSIGQLILYSSLLLILVSFLAHRPVAWIQIGSFVLGGVVMMVSTAILVYATPRFSLYILRNSKAFLTECLEVLYKSSVILGFLSIGVIGAGFLICNLILGTTATIGFSAGVCLAAFFMRIGGGLYKAGSEIATLTITITDPKLPAFDKRSPATLLNLAGDTIGKLIGFGSDIASSFIFTFTAVLLLGFTVFGRHPLTSALLSFPSLVIAAGFLAAVLAAGIAILRIRQKMFNNVLLEGLYGAVILCAVLTYGISRMLHLNLRLSLVKVGDISLFPAYFIGLVGAVLIAFTTEYLTSFRFRPAKKLAKEAENGAAISLINSISLVFRSQGIYGLYLIAIGASVYYLAGIYGFAMASMGMLSATAMLLSITGFSALARHLHKVAALSDLNQTTQKNTAKMDSIGNTTQSLGNGFSSGAAILSTMGLFCALIVMGQLSFDLFRLVTLDWVVGVVMGTALPFLFSGFVLKGLNKATFTVVNELERQFREIPFLIEGKAKPDMTTASDTLSRVSMNALIIPGLLLVALPVGIGYIFGIKMLIGFASGTFLICFSQAFQWSNIGDSLDNAAYHIRSGHFGGKTSATYGHISTANGVGEAAKELIGPSMGIVMKSVTIVSLMVIYLFQ